MRRVLAGALVMLVGYGLFSIVSAMFSGSGTPTQAAPAPAPTLQRPTVDAAAASTSSSSTTSTTIPAVKPRTTPTPDNKAVVYIAGDSDAGSFGPYLGKLVKQTKVATTNLDYKVSSGLARPDFFDWPAHFHEAIPKVNPDIVVVTFGGNDAQGLSRRDGTFIVGQPTGNGDEEWRVEYAKRVGEAMDYLGGDNRTLIWVGIPNHTNPDVALRMQVQNEVVKAEAAKHPKVVFIDSWSRFAGLSGGFAETVLDPRDGQYKDVRADDGFHLNQTGAEILALDINDAIRTELKARGATL